MDVKLDTNAVDYAILAIYFVAVLGIGLFAGSETTRRRPRRDRAGTAGDGRFRR